MEKQTRARNVCLILYPEDENHMKALDYVINHYASYAYITHDKDVNENGEIKKAHIHMVMQFKNARYLNAVASEIGLEPNYIQKCRNLEYALEYLLHLNTDEKYTYELKEVKGTTDLIVKLKNQINNLGQSEGEKGYSLMQYIYDYVGYLEMSRFISYCYSVGMWDVCRRNYSMFKDIITEHNWQYGCKKGVLKDDDNLLD